MNAPALLKIDKELENKFAKAIVNMDFQLLSEILHNDGEFNIQDKEFETKDVNKKGFIKWITTKRNEITQVEYYFDQCLHCKIGNPVVIFNNGSFPREIKDSSEKSKTGLMLNVKDNKIDTVQFCYTLLNTENKCMFEINGDIVKEYLGASFPSKDDGNFMRIYLDAFNECKKNGLIKSYKGDNDN